MDAMEAPQQELEAGTEQLSIMGPHSLQMLEAAGVASSDIKKLQEGGLHTVEAVAHASNKTLVAIKGITEVKIKKLKEAGASGAPFAEHGSKTP